uniref:Uncharacterized protein n=1 Tax=Ditylenchus dipsaci TaxID=166011 RepID=A0A915EEV0_9BILA
MNKFEKDFLIFPEYSEQKKSSRSSSTFAKWMLILKKALVATSAAAKDALPAQIVHVIGGNGFYQKDLLLLTESLSKDDLSVFTIFNQIQSAAALISIYGTPEQKEKYLPRIAEFKCRPCICLDDEQIIDSIETEILKPPGGKELRLNGIKTNVIGADAADIFIVFAKQKVGDVETKRCVILDREDLGGGAVDVQERIQTQGLNAVHYSKVRFTNVLITETSDLGTDESVEDISNELAINGKTFYGAAVVGSLKKLIAQLCDFANSRMEGNLRLADTHPVQTALSELAVGVYVLESMVYYIGGLCDERLLLLNDLENSIIQRYANRVLRKAINAICDIAGITGANCEFQFEKMIRDIVTLISSSESDLKLVRRISLPTMETYIHQHGDMLNLMKKFTFTKLLQGHLSWSEKFEKPRPSHFLAEHVHPSLAESAVALENSMNRINHVIDRLVTDKGLFIKSDYVSLKSLATVMENNLGMVASIARASRSYSIGLKNADDELAWTNFFCATASKETENILREVINCGLGLVKLNPKLTGVGKAVLDARGYNLESPVERNW